MAEEARRYRIPVVFEIAGSDREQAAQLLHALLARWSDDLAKAPVLDERGAPTHPVKERWFPEVALKHVDGNTREAQHLRNPNAFIDEYEDTPVMELLAEAFPEAPNPDDYRTAGGELDENAWGIAFDNFTGEALDLAVKVTRIDDLTERVERAEALRDGLADLLERTPLPKEPQRQDYLVTVAPRYVGEIEGSRYDWDYAGWQGDFNAAALIREQQLHQLLTGAGGRSPVPPPRFQNEWLPRDLIAIQALHDLVDQEESHEPARRLLSRESRTHLRAMLHVSDLDVRVQDEDGRDLYAGVSSLAVNVLPAGVYEATTLFGDEPARLVVGPAGRHNQLTSAAFPRGEHDGAVLDEIARTMQAVPDQDLRARLSAVLATVGRSGSQIVQPMTRLEHGVLLSELLRQRHERLAGDGRPGIGGPGTAAERGTEPDGLSR